MEITKATIQATLLDLLPGSPPALLYEKTTRYKEGNRLFTQKVTVPDLSLFQRLCSGANKGDAIKITVTTEWHTDHSVAYVSAIELTHKDDGDVVAGASPAPC